MEVHHYDYYAVANAPHRTAASALADGRHVRAALGARSSVKLTVVLQRCDGAAA